MRLPVKWPEKKPVVADAEAAAVWEKPAEEATRDNWPMQALCPPLPRKAAKCLSSAEYQNAALVMQISPPVIPLLTSLPSKLSPKAAASMPRSSATPA